MTLRHETREAWLAARRLLSVNASNVPTLLGIADSSAPWAMTTDDIFREKVGLAEPKTHPKDVEEWREWGLTLEPIIATKYAQVTGYKVENRGEFTIATAEAYPWFGATFDRMALHPELGWGPVQCKNVGASARGEWMKMTDRKKRTYEQLTPREKWSQVQAEMFVAGAKWAGIAALIGGNTFLTREILRNEEFIQSVMLPPCIGFHERITEYRASGNDPEETFPF